MLSFQTVLPDTLELLKRLMDVPLLSPLRLVGGTSLALQYGHRRSVDLDLFGDLEEDTEKVTAAISDVGNVIQGICSKSIKTYRIDGVKTDFVNYNRYPWIDDAVTEEGIRLASPRDIAAMKINAVMGRGSRKDFTDIYMLLQHFSLDEIMDFYKKKYPEHSEFRALLSLTYFEDAEIQPMPDMFINVKWDEMKRCITEAVENYNTIHLR